MTNCLKRYCKYLVYFIYSLLCSIQHQASVCLATMIKRCGHESGSWHWNPTTECHAVTTFNASVLPFRLLDIYLVSHHHLFDQRTLLNNRISVCIILFLCWSRNLYSNIDMTQKLTETSPETSRTKKGAESTFQETLSTSLCWLAGSAQTLMNAYSFILFREQS